MPERRRVHLTPFWRLIARRWLGTVICVLALVTLVSGFGGFAWQYAASTSTEQESPPNAIQKAPPSPDWTIPVFKTAQLFILNSGADDDPDHPSNWLLAVARISAAALFVIVSSAIILRIRDEVRGLPSLLMRRDHVVICGLGQIGLQLLDDLDAQGRAKEAVIIEKDPANPWLEYARNMGATVVIGDSTKADALAEARAARAAEVFVVTGDDGVNLEVTAEMGMLLASEKREGEPLRLYAHVVDTNFATTLRPYCKVLHDSNNMAVQVFNVPRTAAAMLVTRQLWPYAPKEPHEVAHFAILGFGAMGQALAVQLAQLGHFPNRKRSRFTIADRDIEQSAKLFMSRFPRFTSWTDGGNEKLGVDSFPTNADAWEWNERPLPPAIRIESDQAVQYVCNAEFVEIPGSRSDERLALKLAERFSGDDVKPVIFICGQQDLDNFEAAVQLRDQLACYGKTEVPIFVWLPRQPALAETLSRTPEGAFVPFGECRSAASYEEITAPMRESVGKKIQAAYENQAAERAASKDETHIKKSWSSIPDDHRESNRVAADHMLIKLNCVGVRLVRRTDKHATRRKFTQKFPAAVKQKLAEMEHYRWVSERLLAGWRYCPKGESEEDIRAYKKRRLNHNITSFELSEMEKDFDQIDVIYDECQVLDGFVLEPLETGESSTRGEE